MELTLTFKKDALGFENLSKIITYVQTNPDFQNQKFIDDNYENLRYFYNNLAYSKNKKISLTSQVTFDDRIRYYHFSKIYQPIKFLFCKLIETLESDNIVLELSLKNFEEAKVIDRWFIRLIWAYSQKSKNKHMALTFDSNPNYILSTKQSYELQDMEYFGEEFKNYFSGDALALFKKSMDMALYEDAIKAGNQYLKKHSSDYNIELFVGLAYVVCNQEEKGESHYINILKNSTDPKLIANTYYSLAMLHMRHAKSLNENKAKIYLQKGMEIIQDNKNILGDEYLYQYIFNRNGQALIEFKEKNFGVAHQYCVDGQWKLFYKYGNQKHLLHRTVLLYNCTMTSEAMKNYNESLIFFNTLLSLDPYFPDYWLHKAKLHEQMDEPDSVLESLNRALDLAPYEDSLYQHKALFFEARGDIYEAIKCLEIALKINPYSETAYQNLSAIYIENGDMKKVIELFHSVYILDKPDLVTNLVTALESIGKSNEALNVLCKVKVVNANIYGTKAYLLYQNKEFVEALKEIEKALAINEKNAIFLENKLRILEKLDPLKAKEFHKDNEEFFIMNKILLGDHDV